MKQRHHLNKTGRDRRQQFGQSMVEYTVVIAFGILTLSTGLMTDAVDDLMATIHQNYAGYSFAISLSDYPDDETVSDYWTMLDDQAVNTDMRHVLTDKSQKGIGNRTSVQYTTAVEYYQTSPPAVGTIITGEAGSLQSLSIP